MAFYATLVLTTETKSFYILSLFALFISDSSLNLLFVLSFTGDCSFPWMVNGCFQLILPKLAFVAFLSHILSYHVIKISIFVVPASINNSAIVARVEAIENSTVYLDCPVNGIPTPSIMWLKVSSPCIQNYIIYF